MSDKKITMQKKIPVRFVTATSLFDGHDASINIFRRLLQANGVEVIHLGHNRTAEEVALAAIQEDAHGICLSSYQGGHMEYFTYIRKILDEKGGEKIKIFGGGGGVITIDEAKVLEEKGVEKIYTPEDGQSLGLIGIIEDIIKRTPTKEFNVTQVPQDPFAKVSRHLSFIENQIPQNFFSIEEKPKKTPLVIGLTGTGGAGKSSLLDELLLRFLWDFNDIKIAALCIDPSKKKTGGALLGDRIRINTCSDKRIYLRSFASRDSKNELSIITEKASEYLKNCGEFDLVFVETSGIGQGNSKILDIADISLYVMTPEYGAQSQLEKIDMLDYADLIVINKFERQGGLDAAKDVEQILRRSRYGGLPPKDNDYPVFGTITSQFNNEGVNCLFDNLILKLKQTDTYFIKRKDNNRPSTRLSEKRNPLIPSNRRNYLSLISSSIRSYHSKKNSQIKTVDEIDSITKCMKFMDENNIAYDKEKTKNKLKNIENNVDKDLKAQIDSWQSLCEKYRGEKFSFQVREKTINIENKFEALSEKKYPKVFVPRNLSKSQLSRFLLEENLPGYFPYTAGLFYFRRQGEDPKRQFAGEGGPVKTNARFHYLSKDDEAKRLSTAFDSVTLYGSDPDKRPDIFGKIGESGVSVANLVDMEDLFKRFDLCHPKTSVSMTINGPAPIILAMFFNTAINQQIKKFEDTQKRKVSTTEYKSISKKTLQTVRGTVQADILKEDQAQNTCIFSTDFALKLMGDVQEYFTKENIKNYYAVSISGYHIAEAGANPITQLAFTLANGFTYVEYYLKRGLSIDDFASNLSFFFSNGLDPEYSVLGRVARRIWAIAMRDFYKANSKSQKLKYHIQTSGRSLHAQEMSFNDIRTTLQALLALYDNCNSLHTNAYDEALTTPTEESVRRAMAIQLIINKEFGPNKCENVNQGSFFISELTDLVEESVLVEFENICNRGGVLGAMETQYQRTKIQEESLHYEHLKHSGKYPLVGINTFLNTNSEKNKINRENCELIRSSYEEKDDQIKRLEIFCEESKGQKNEALKRLVKKAVSNQNMFEELMETVKFCSLGEITETLYNVGGKYRRSM